MANSNNRERVIYKIHLQSDENDEIKVIDRFCRCYFLFLNLMFLLQQFQHERDEPKAQDLLWTLIVLRSQATLGKCPNDCWKVGNATANCRPKVQELLLLAIQENQQSVQAKESRKHGHDEC